MVIQYERPREWIAYDPRAVLQALNGKLASPLERVVIAAF